jgi:membrane protein YdbS with pleckstrin-like domain
MVVLYAEARGIFGTTTDTERAELFAQLARIESRVQKSTLPPAEPIVTGRIRDLVVFVVALLTCVAIAAIVGVAQATPIGFIAAFAVGLCIALFYVWLAPLVTRARE